MIFRQLFEKTSSTYTYILADANTKDAIIIDPVIETVDRDFKVINDLGLKLKYAINTHVHADHVTGSGLLKQKIPGCKSVICDPNAKADIHINEGDKLNFGIKKIEFLSTPGHTNGCVSIVCHSAKSIFTGDALLIRGCGRTDFQQGNPGLLYDSIHTKVFTLPNDYIVFPAHDYTGQTNSSIGEEKKYNPRLSKSKEEFIQIMNNLNLPYPAQIDRALPANLVCGVQE
ncbi:unnamed protein product [Brachionus calyciflorus]|uniref:Persulfide dioxygenase ETHE1, mitochondrial n=1 Tax=Brachionus calyciflorus TaxID=104777 RepID=A0A814KI62_9BILA|nr:unnamed protein product [Brachionus calyciflorus]